MQLKWLRTFWQIRKSSEDGDVNEKDVDDFKILKRNIANFEKTSGASRSSN